MEWKSIENCQATNETEKALLVKLPDHRQYWFPKSQISLSSDIRKDLDKGRLIVSKWCYQSITKLSKKRFEHPDPYGNGEGLDFWTDAVQFLFHDDVDF